MRCPRLLESVLALCVSAAIVPCSFGAAQLKAGAKTSAAPTATNPQQREIQITFDPVVTPGIVLPPPDGGGDPGYDVDAFQLSVGYDASLMTVGEADLVPPFYPPVPPGAAGPALGNEVPGDPCVGYTVDPTTGTISFLKGATNNPTDAGPGDVNIFTIDFILNVGVSFDTALNFSIFGSDANGDFIQGYDPVTEEYFSTDGSNITPTFLTTTFNQATQATGGGASTPLPAGALAGLLALGCCGWIIRRKNAPCGGELCVVSDSLH